MYEDNINVIMKNVQLLIIIAFGITIPQCVESATVEMPHKFDLERDIREEIRDIHIQQVTIEEHGVVRNASLVAEGGALFGPPIPPEVIVAYYLYTSHNPEHPENLTAENLKGSSLNIKQPLKIIIHGWLQSATAENMLKIKDEYLKHENLNVIVVDWSSIAGIALYPQVVVYTKDVGHLIGQFTDALIKFGFDHKNIHLIGFSLGAHVAGFATEEIPQKIPRITGLDPAYPGYAKERLKVFGGDGRLCTKNAEFVDILHTNAGYLGIPFPIGHVDFFANGGAKQPGCIPLLYYMCSHGRAPEYFAESIKTSTFPAKPCNGSETDHILMGDPVPLSANGSFCLKTHDTSPFGEKKSNR